MSIRISARPPGGFRRAGYHHPAEPTIYPDAFFTPGEIDVLRAESQLIVELLDDEFYSSGERARGELQLVSSSPAAGVESSCEDANQETRNSGTEQPGAPAVPHTSEDRIPVAGAQGDSSSSVSPSSPADDPQAATVEAYCGAAHLREEAAAYIADLAGKSKRKKGK